MYYKKCLFCGANLDPGEHCDCRKPDKLDRTQKLGCGLLAAGFIFMLSVMSSSLIDTNMILSVLLVLVSGLTMFAGVLLMEDVRDYDLFE